MSKWYYGLEASEIVERFKVRSFNVFVDELEYSEFKADYDELREKIIAIKNEFYEFNKEIYNMWQKCLGELDEIAIDTYDFFLREENVK